MGYCEYVCQLCNVSFAIARIRTLTEPNEAAWKYYGSDFIEDGYQTETSCQPFSDTGCSVHKRPDWEESEHLAGPGCRSTLGYCGGRISVAEMRGCRAIRALIQKSNDSRAEWEDEDDDESWERETRYFFSGTGDGSPDEAPLTGFDKERHGITSVPVTNLIAAVDADFAMPVHPSCWEIFKRVSRREAGFVDVHGLWRFNLIEGSWWAVFEKFPRHPAVRSCREQWWCHAQGSEWLAANPVAIPGFPGSLRTDDLVYPDPGWFDVNEEVFQRRPRRRVEVDLHSDANGQQQDDPIARLPPELRLKILDFLPSKSIAAARLVFRSMYPLPNIIFRRLVFEDQPWLWEAQDLPPSATNWYRLYMTAKFTWIELKGMKNRVRIWKEVNEIIRRILEYRARGVIRGVTGWEEDAMI